MKNAKHKVDYSTVLWFVNRGGYFFKKFTQRSFVFHVKLLQGVACKTSASPYKRTVKFYIM